nr:transcription termination factor 1, mitochondrial isoform X4 [Globicephala melas]
MCLGTSEDENHIGSADGVLSFLSTEFWSFRTGTGIKLASFNCSCNSSSNGVITSLFMCPKGNLELKWANLMKKNKHLRVREFRCERDLNKNLLQCS